MSILGERILTALSDWEWERHGPCVLISLPPPGSIQCHTGLLIGDEQGGAKVLHFYWYDRLGVHAPNKLPQPIIFSVARANEPAHPLVLSMYEAIAEFAERIYAAYERRDIDWPYSFTADSSLSQEGQFVPGATQPPGFTCATLVLALFEAVGASLLERASWPPPSAEDQAWQAQICQSMSAKHPDHAAALSQHVGGVSRFHPLDVLCAAAAERKPASYAQVGGCAQCLKRALPMTTDTTAPPT